LTAVIPKTKSHILIYDGFDQQKIDLFTKILETRYNFRYKQCRKSQMVVAVTVTGDHPVLG